MNLEKLLQQAQERRSALYESSKSAKTLAELDQIEVDMRKVDMEIKDLKEKIAERDAGEGEDPAARDDNNGEGPEQRTFNPLGTYGGNPSRRSIEGEEDMYSSLEYRQAFRNYIVSGTPIPEKFKAFNWNVIEVNGHDLDELHNAIESAKAFTEGPTCIVMHTVKGKGVEEMEGQAGWHGKAPSEEQGVAFVNEIMGVQ